MSTILMVDDYPAVRKALRTLLESPRCSVVCIEAADGLDAIAMTEISRPELIILDLFLPEMHGFEAATSSRKPCRKVPSSCLLFSSAAGLNHERRWSGWFSKSAGINALVEQASDLLNPAHALARPTAACSFC